MQVKSADKEAVGSYQLEYYTRQEAINKGIRASLITLGAAILSVALPGVHFVSVQRSLIWNPIGAMSERGRCTCLKIRGLKVGLEVWDQETDGRNFTFHAGEVGGQGNRR